METVKGSVHVVCQPGAGYLTNQNDFSFSLADAIMFSNQTEAEIRLESAKKTGAFDKILGMPRPGVISVKISL